MMLGLPPLTDDHTASLNCSIQLLRGEVLHLLVVDQPKVEQMIQALQADGAEGGQSE